MLDPEDPRLKALLKERARFGRAFRELTLVRKDGSKFPAEISSSIFLDAKGEQRTSLVIRDITERKQVMESLQKEQELMNSLMDHTADSIYFKDLQGRFLRVSRNLAVKHGERDPRQIIGKTDFDFFDRQSARKFHETEQKIIRTGKPQVDIEEEEKWADGRVTWASTTTIPYRDKDGKIIGIIGITRDITARKQAEIKLRESEERFRSLYENATIGIYQTTPDGQDINGQSLPNENAWV